MLSRRVLSFVWNFVRFLYSARFHFSFSCLASKRPGTARAYPATTISAPESRDHTGAALRACVVPAGAYEHTTYGSTLRTNAACCAVDTELDAPVAAGTRAVTPILVGSSAACAAMTPRQFDTILLVTGAGLERVRCYSAHSDRIERDCRLLAAGAS